MQSFPHQQSQAIASNITFTKLVAKLNVSWLYVTGTSADGRPKDSLGQSVAAQKCLEATSHLDRKTVRPSVHDPHALVDFIKPCLSVMAPHVAINKHKKQIIKCDVLSY